MLEMDNIDELFQRETQRKATDFIFISKHASAAGTPALTVHPIGNPGRARADMGGMPATTCRGCSLLCYCSSLLLRF